ncbi:hypothetical protein E2562_032134 [Oryza meyeriana var. granulata]|uniref:Uncharacterized protein n=1 Tax=Oryza meyeriana var. granulata TaxID=110450 RepID=A0A6G1CK37_9ORYZ|nr:hypothetical protein E2562_032134 [Oryza meyeriana var. granulata]
MKDLNGFSVFIGKNNVVALQVDAGAASGLRRNSPKVLNMETGNMGDDMRSSTRIGVATSAY